jgi:ribosome recycling factor
MPITAIVNTNQSTTVELRTNKTTVSMLPILTTADASSLASLSQIQDVDASDPDNNEVLVYDQTQNKYVIKTLPVVQGGTF